MRLYMPGIFKEPGIVLLFQVAERGAIEYRSTLGGIGDPGEKILQGGRIEKSWIKSRKVATAKGEYASGFGIVAKERPHEEGLHAKLEGMLAAQKGNMIHNVIILGRAIRFRQIWIAA